MATRLRRVEQVERNREAVLDAARKVFLDRGYAGATLEAIAEAAGFSKGVVYSQFGSKADLFLALLDRRIEERAARNERIARRGAGADGVRELVRVAERDVTAASGWARLLIEFRALAARDPELNRRYAASHARSVEHLVSVLGRLHDKGALTPAVPLPAMASFIFAVGSGVTLERLANAVPVEADHLVEMVGRALGLDASP